MKKVTAPELFELIAGKSEDTTFRDALVSVLEKFEGKTITKRLATAAKKAFPAYTFHYEVDKTFGFSAKLTSWKGRYSDGERESFCLGKSKTFSLEAFKEANPAHFAADSRNEARLAYLESGKLAELAETVNTVNAAVAKLRALLDECPEGHAVEELVDVQRLGFYSKLG